MNMAAATWVKCWKLWHINHWNAQSAMWCDTVSHPGGGGGIVCLNAVCLRSVSLFVCHSRRSGGLRSAFRVGKCVTPCDSESLIVRARARCFLESIKRSCLGISRSVYRSGMMSLLWVWSGEIVMGPEPRTRNHPIMLRTCHSSADFFVGGCELMMWDPVALCGPFGHGEDLFFPSERAAEGLCSCHQFQMTPADDIGSYSPITEVQGLVGVGVESRITCKFLPERRSLCPK